LIINGIIAEFNPLHNGHKYIIDKAKENSDGVICVMSGNFVQRGDIAILSKFERAKMAIEAGVDLCIELPTPWAMSTAQTFAQGGVSIFDRLGVIDSIYFGSECGDIDLLQRAVQIFENKNFVEMLTAQLKNGVTFAAARQTVADRIDPDAAQILNSSNDILGIEYICALNRTGSNITPKCVKRQGVIHDSGQANGDFLSASQIRKIVSCGDFESIKTFVPKNVFELIEKGNVADINRIENDILGKLRRTSLAQLRDLPDISEGIENRLLNAAKASVNLEELYSFIKTKRYTLSRVRRLVLSAYLDLKAKYTTIPVPYARVLGFSKKGEEIIRLIQKNTQIPLIMRTSEIENLDTLAQEIFKCETIATDLYALSLSKPLPCGTEYTQKIIKGE